MPDTSSPFLFRLVQNHFKLLFWSFFTAAFITGYLQVLQNKELTNETATHGIISLELACTFQKDTSIISSWKTIIPVDSVDNNCVVQQPENRLVPARTNIIIDFFFIFFYTGFAIVIICWLQLHAGIRKMIFTKLLIWTVIVMGVADIIENIGMLKFIGHGLINSPASTGDTFITCVSSHIKFALLIGLGLIYLPYMLIVRNRGLQMLSDIIKRRGEQLFRYRIIFLGVIVFVLPMWILDQGQDLLVNSNAENWGVIVFLTAVVIAALLNWYLAKLFFQQKYIGPVYPFKEPLVQDPSEKKVARFLGVTTILLPAAAILNALKVTRIGYPFDIFPPAAWLLMLLSIFYALIKYDVAGKIYYRMVESNRKARASAISFILIGLLGVLIPVIIRVTMGHNSYKPTSLIALYWHLVLISFAFYIFVSTRSSLFPSGWLGNYIGKLVFVLTMIASIFFIWINIFPKVFVRWDNHFATLPLLLAGLICYIFLSTLLIRLGQWLKINLVLFLVVIGLAFNLVNTNNYHEVDMNYYPRKDSTMKPLELKDYFKEWVLARETEINAADSTYPVFLVNTYGGGIRAAAFTSMVMTYLDSKFIGDTNLKKAFEHYTFSISGASGGTIGAAIQCAYRNKYMDTDSAYKLDSFFKFYQHDFLTSVLIPDLGRDIWASATSISSWDDRSAIQEKLWAGFAEKYLNLNLGVDFDSIWSRGNKRNNYEVPLLFSNTLNVDDGLKGICAPVYLSDNDFPATIFIRDRLDSINAYQNKNDSTVKGISLITGAFLSARFPFISPSGKMGPGFHFMDGGGKDNSGASTSELIFATLGRYVGKQSAIKQSGRDSVFIELTKKIHFYFVSINNSPHKKADKRKLVENRFELISPLVGIINSGIDGNAHAADSTLRARYGLDSLRHLGFFTGYISVFPTVDCINDTTVTDNYKPVLPLGWQISKPALIRLKASFDEKQVEDNSGNGILRILKIMKIK